MTVPKVRVSDRCGQVRDKRYKAMMCAAMKILRCPLGRRISSSPARTRTPKHRTLSLMNDARGGERRGREIYSRPLRSKRNSTAVMNGTMQLRYTSCLSGWVGAPLIAAPWHSNTMQRAKGRTVGLAVSCWSGRRRHRCIWLSGQVAARESVFAGRFAPAHFGSLACRENCAPNRVPAVTAASHEGRRAEDREGMGVACELRAKESRVESFGFRARKRKFARNSRC